MLTAGFLVLFVAAVAVLRTTAVAARHQAEAVDPVADAEPGKILHEVRHGEMAELGEVPFRHYYGSVDSTPLFVMLAGDYLERTGDVATIARIWPNIERAIGWIADYGDRDNDGFVEYGRRNENGLVNQGWKDSFDSIFHADGSIAEGPIALCEVQGYVYAAYVARAHFAREAGDDATHQRYAKKARDLRERFNEDFWSEEHGTYALALDADKRRVDAVVGQIRRSARLPGFEEVRIPGDRRPALREERLAGGIPIGPELAAALGTLARDLGIPAPT